jgi:hypothetical protein
MSTRTRHATFAESRRPGQGELSDELELAALPSAPCLTRRFIEEYLSKWSLDGLADVASVVASEIVTNAVKAAVLTEQPTGSPAPHDRCIGRVVTRLCWSGPSLVIETWDGEPRPPVVAAATDLDEYGRGLMIVAALAAEWGHYPAASGKVVWARLTIPGTRGPAGPGRPPGTTR